MRQRRRSHVRHEPWNVYGEDVEKLLDCLRWSCLRGCLRAEEIDERDGVRVPKAI